MAIAQRISEEEYQRLVFATRNWTLELHDGRVGEKPGKTWNHADVQMNLGFQLHLQLDRADFSVFFSGRCRRPPATIYVPDVLVVPTAYGHDLRNRPDVLAIFSQPLPLISEIWSSVSDEYKVDAKLPLYRSRGDLEIWRIHPYERTLTAWVRQDDGSYRETVHCTGNVALSSLPGVTIDLDELFDN